MPAWPRSLRPASATETEALLAELVAAFMLLSRLPVGWLGQTHSDDAFARSVWAYPIVGATVGTLGAVVYILSARIGLPPSLAAICALTGTVLATGALHEDALADMVDGFGGGRSRARKLEIMHDSRVGSFGALALILSTAVRITAVASIAIPGKVAMALIAAAIVGRGAMIVPLLVLTAARMDGLAAGLGATATTRAFVGLVLSAAAPFFLLPTAAAAATTACAIVAASCLSAIAWRQIGGYTGDVLGAIEVVAECVVLGLLTTGPIGAS